MAEESIIDQEMSEKIEPEDGDEKANQIDRITVKKGPPKVVSRYLSGPKGSCHDLCKYGIQHALEAKPWSKAKKRDTRKERKTKVPEENVTCSAGTKKSGSSPRTSLTSKTFESSIPVDIKEVINEKAVTSERTPTAFEETDVDVSMEHHNSDIRQSYPEPSSLPVQEDSKSQTKRKILKNKVAFGSSSIRETESRSKQTKTSLTGGKEKSKPSHNVKKPSSSSAKTAKNLRGASSLKNHKNVEEAKPELESNDNQPDKILHVVEPANANLCEEPTQACDATELSSPLSSSSGDKRLKQTSKKTSKSGVSASSRKSLKHGTRVNVSVAPPHLSSGDKGKRNMHHKRGGSISRSSSVLSSISSYNSSLGKQNATTKLKKTGLKKTRSAASSRSSSASSISSSTVSRRKQNGATSSKSNKTGHRYQGENVKVGYKIRLKLSTVVGEANKVAPVRKLTFRRGKVIEVHTQATNIPRKLKFRPARLLGDDYQRDINGTRKRLITSKVGDNGESKGANIKPEKVVHKLQSVEGSKRRITGRKAGGERSKTDGSKSGSEKVVLRHQDVEGKKVNPRLYNNVIEETASMLAELRKSKVKALVGAFETVISLDSPRVEASPTATDVGTTC